MCNVKDLSSVLGMWSKLQCDWMASIKSRPQPKYAMDTPLFALNAIEVDKFIDKWEEHPCLWQVTHPNYRSRVSRRIALQNISDAFGRGWTIDQVRRKIESLKTYWRDQRRREKYATTTEEPTGRRTVWTYYDRLSSFLGLQTEGIPNNWSQRASACSEEANSNNADFLNRDEERDREGSTTPDIKFPFEVNGGPLTPSPTTSSQTVTSHQELQPCPSPSPERTCILPPPIAKKKRMLEHASGKSKSDQFEECVVEVLRNLQGSIKEQKQCRDSIFNYVITVGDRLREIKNKRKLLETKAHIDKIIYEALISEASDSDD